MNDGHSLTVIHTDEEWRGMFKKMAILKFDNSKEKSGFLW